MTRQKLVMGAFGTIFVLLIGLWLAIRFLASSATLSALWKIALLVMAASLCLLASLIGMAAMLPHPRRIALRRPAPISVALLAYLFPAIALVLPFWLMVQLLPGASGSPVGLLSAWFQPTPPWLFIGQTVLLAVALFVWYFLPEKIWKEVIPLERPIWMVGMLAGSGFWLIATFSTSLIARQLAIILPGVVNWNASLPLNLSSPGLLAAFSLSVVVAVIIAPPAEEYLFRRLLIRYWQPRLGALGAAAASAALFATLQGRPLLWLPAFLLGMGLYFLAETTGHLRVAIFAHVVFNILALCVNWTGIL